MERHSRKPFGTSGSGYGSRPQLIGWALPAEATGVPSFERLIMTPAERERVKTALQAYLEPHQLTSRDLGTRIKADGKKVHPKTLHRFFDRHLLTDDSVMEVYRAFVDRPG